MSISQRVKLAIVRRRLSSSKIASGSESALEIWEQNKLRADFKRSAELRKAIDRDDLGTIERPDMREYQLYKFRMQMANVMENSYYYRKKYEAAGVKPEDIRTWDDLQKVPLTEPADLLRGQAEAMRGVHRLEHVLHELLKAGPKILHLPPVLLQTRVAIGHNTQNHRIHLHLLSIVYVPVQPSPPAQRPNT